MLRESPRFSRWRFIASSGVALPWLDCAMSSVTALALSGTSAVLGHIGEGRAYLLRRGVLRRISADRTLAALSSDHPRSSAIFPAPRSVGQTARYRMCSLRGSLWSPSIRSCWDLPTCLKRIRQRNECANCLRRRIPWMRAPRFSDTPRRALIAVAASPQSWSGSGTPAERSVPAVDRDSRDNLVTTLPSGRCAILSTDP